MFVTFGMYMMSCTAASCHPTNSITTASYHSIGVFLRSSHCVAGGDPLQSVVGLLAKLQLPANPTRSGSQTHGHALTSAAAATDDYK